MAATRFECREWIEHGRVDVLQPDVNRAGGLTEMVRIAQLGSPACSSCRTAGRRGSPPPPRVTSRPRRRTSRSSSTSPPTSSTRRCGESSSRPSAIVDGAIELPTAPGLGIELDADAVERYRA